MRKRSFSEFLNSGSSIIGSLLVAAALARGVLAQEAVTPGPEHELLKKFEGNWTAKIKMGEEESAGSASYKMECGGLWLASTFQGEFMGQKFEGRGIDGFDADKKKFVSVWVDSMVTKPMMLEGTYDKESKTMTMTGEAKGPDGNMAKHKLVTKRTDDDHFTFTMYIVGPDKEETKVMTIDYARKK